MNVKRVCILGGSGFVGRHICALLARQRVQIRVLTRRRETAKRMLVYPTLELVEANVHSAAELSGHFRGCDAVINLVGILNEGSNDSEQFSSAHDSLAGNVVEACRVNGVSRLLHMSALNAKPDAPSAYLKTKAAGETAAHAAKSSAINVTSFQPSVIFGPDDSFFNRFASLLSLSPVFFPLACPDSRFAPVYVDDVAKAFVDCLGDKSTYGERFELCGPRTYSLIELVEYTARVAGLKRKIIGLSDWLSKLQALALELVPGKPFSYDNYLSLSVDSVCTRDGLAQLGITPTAVETIVPSYLGKDNRPNRYQDLRSHAGRS